MTLAYTPPTGMGNTGVSADGFDLRKRGATMGWDAGVFDGQHAITQTGFAQVRVETKYSGYRLFGLTTSDIGGGFCPTRYGLELVHGGTLEIYENCVRVAYPPVLVYGAGDQLRIEADAGVVRYKRQVGGSGNWQVLYTSTLPVTAALYFNASLYTPGSTLKEIRFVIGSTAAPSVNRTYYTFGGARVAMRDGAGAPLAYLHGDHLGSASLATSMTGTVLSQQRYAPYGEVRWASGAGMPTDFTYTGQRAGPANYVGSLMDYVSRSYSPALGRFVSADTIVPGAGSSQTLNRYMYVFGNPLGMVDPTGHDPWYREKYDMVRSLNAYATDLKKGVASGNVKPVQAIVELSARTWEATDHNTDNYVWAMTVLLIGADTDQVSLVDYFQGSAQIAHSWSTLETSTVGQDWLPFAAGGPAHNSDQGVQRGDWNAAYWDQTSNQAFHFWTYVSLTYYEGDLVAWAANFFHDPPFGTRDQWREARQGGAGVFSSWARAFIDGGVEVSREDYDLGLAGMRFANAISHYEYVSGQGGQAWRVSKPAADPNEWLRRHLME